MASKKKSWGEKEEKSHIARALKNSYSTAILLGLALILTACLSTKKEVFMKQTMNPALYFEIPVNDMQRATSFYKAVFGFDFVYENIHDNEMAMLPFHQDALGITGALAKGSVYQPSKSGVIIYLASNDINATIDRALKHGGKQLFPRTQANEYGFVGEIEDSEGNRIGLSEPL
jgi:predicted enzyme related to lactoylglutathione lyase